MQAGNKGTISSLLCREGEKEGGRASHTAAVDDVPCLRLERSVHGLGIRHRINKDEIETVK